MTGDDLYNLVAKIWDEPSGEIVDPERSSPVSDDESESKKPSSCTNGSSLIILRSGGLTDRSCRACVSLFDRLMHAMPDEHEADNRQRWQVRLDTRVDSSR